MRILVIASTFPWPARSGQQLRVANIVRALAGLGEIDLFSSVSTREPASDALMPQILEPVARLGLGTRTGISSGFGTTARWLVSSRLPYEIARLDYAGVRSAFQEWARPDYDLTWIARAESHAGLGDLVEAPCVVDLDDLEDQKISAKLRVGAHSDRMNDGAQRRGPRAVAHSLGARIQASSNLRRWHSLQQRVASSVEAVTVCSDVDRQRLRVPNAVVVPNGYAPPPRPAGREGVRNPPTLLVHGSLTYTPNADAADFFVREILPRVQVQIPRARARLAGRHDGRVARLRSDDVALAGEVKDMGIELAKGDVVVVPMRFASGTRIKILEAFAHRIPVVTTAIGCEGLDVTDRRHLLVGDDPDTLAARCVELLVDVGLRRRLTAAAHELYWRRYRWEVIRPQIVDVALRAVDARRVPSSAGMAR
jgi:hypothetical protein